MDTNKAIRLIEFLVRLTSIRSKIERDISQYDGVVWLSSVPGLKNCFTRAWGNSAEHSDDEWLEVQSIREPAMPPVPEDCKIWVEFDKLQDSSKTPDISSEAIFEVKNPNWYEGSGQPLMVQKQALLKDFPEVQKKWEEYIQKEWKIWSENHKEWKKIHLIYSDLFSIYQQQLRLGEEYELVLGVGFLSWITKNNQKIRRHLIVADAQLEFEANLGKFTVRPKSDGSKLRVELDMIELEDQPSGAEQIATEGLASAADDPWDRAHLEPVLKSLVHSINANGSFFESINATAMPSEKPVVEYAPALILRKQSARGLTNVLSEIKKIIENTKKVPVLFSTLVESISSGDHEQKELETEPACGDDEIIYFPKPSNDEQRRIIQKSKNSRGVLVQGPPGTGKSHTIANLICHFLASGKRILVTAKTPRALQVLNGKLPNKMRSLCINLLGTGPEERKSLEASVSGILRENENWIPEAAEEQINKLKCSLKDLREEKTRLERRLRETREAETHTKAIAGEAYVGTAAQIAKHIDRQASIYDWFKDRPDIESEIPFKPDDLLKVVQSFKKFSDEKREELLLTRPLKIPDPLTFGKIVESEKNALESERLTEPNVKKEYLNILFQSPSDFVSELSEKISKLNITLHKLKTCKFSWITQATSDVFTENTAVLQKLFASTSKFVETKGAFASLVDSVSLEIPNEKEIKSLQKDAEALRSHLANGGRLGWGIFRHRVVKEKLHLFKHVKVNGHTPRTVEAFTDLANTLSYQNEIKKIWELWDGYCEKENGPLELQVTKLTALCNLLKLLFELQEDYSECKKLLQQEPAFPHLEWNNIQEGETVIFSCKLAEIRKQRVQIQENIQSFLIEIEQQGKGKKSHPLNTEILNAISQRDVFKYHQIYENLRQLDNDQIELASLNEWVDYFKTVLPQVFHEISLSLYDPVWDERLKNIEKAWKYAMAKRWLEEHTNKEDLPALNNRIKQIEDKIHEIISELASLASWKCCFSRLTALHRSHMEAWRQAMRSLGKGTGKHAHRYRRAAQEHLDSCRDAVPAWVMPLHRIWDTIKPQPGIFDVIIIDEASQCGAEGFPLLFLGKKVLIVGDDKQISPEAVGVPLNTVHNLRNEFLNDFVFKSSFDIETSLFDHGKLRFGSNRITLQEHFRCMPEIIRFSNELCYSETPLIPLRQYGPDRLPPLKRKFVSGGYREGEGNRVINRPEAEAIVEKIEEIMSDSLMKDKTIGVVILQGEAQGKLIEKMLLERIGAKAMEERRLICGNPYTFQGDERNIILLSMVAAPNARIGALTSSADERRFNVAASRAQDMMMLFHSVTIEDLSQHCLRRKLLEFFQGERQKEIAGLKVEELELRAFRDNRQLVEPPEPFDSWFELDVALQILRKGFCVYSQREVAGRYIDIVVEGGTSRLAVECDGDNWHGPEKYEEDMNRQRQLERCGWNFFRIRESTFYADKNNALKQLWHLLEERGIYPLSLKSGNLNDGEENEDELSPETEPLACEESKNKTNRRPEEVSAAEIQLKTIAVLTECPNKTCTQHSLTSRVLKELGILTRGQPYAEFERRVLRSVTVLESRNILERYKAKNKRIRLKTNISTGK